MARGRKNEQQPVDIALGIVQLLGVIAILWVYRLYTVYLKSREEFNRTLAQSVIVMAILVVIAAIVLALRKKMHDSKYEKIMSRVRNSQLNEELNNFILRFGRDRGAKSEIWSFREYKFRNDRLQDLQKIVSEQGLALNEQELRELLSLFIQERAFKETQAGVSEAPKPLLSLSGADFERLLTRLFEKMGHVVTLNGRSGDQGADLILMKEGMRTVVQAKRYSGAVGNEAVQQAAAAKQYYDGNSATVVTSAVFTKSAVELAKATSVELIDGARLRNLLSHYLKENWN